MLLKDLIQKKYLQILIVLKRELSMILMNKFSSTISLKMYPAIRHRRRGRKKLLLEDLLQKKYLQIS